MTPKDYESEKRTPLASMETIQDLRYDNIYFRRELPDSEQFTSNETYFKDKYLSPVPSHHLMLGTVHQLRL